MKDAIGSVNGGVPLNGPEGKKEAQAAQQEAPDTRLADALCGANSQKPRSVLKNSSLERAVYRFTHGIPFEVSDVDADERLTQEKEQKAAREEFRSKLSDGDKLHIGAFRSLHHIPDSVSDEEVLRMCKESLNAEDKRSAEFAEFQAREHKDLETFIKERPLSQKIADWVDYQKYCFMNVGEGRSNEMDYNKNRAKGLSLEGFVRDKYKNNGQTAHEITVGNLGSGEGSFFTRLRFLR